MESLGAKIYDNDGNGDRSILPGLICRRTGEHEIQVNKPGSELQWIALGSHDILFGKSIRLEEVPGNILLREEVHRRFEKEYLRTAGSTKTGTKFFLGLRNQFFMSGGKLWCQQLEGEIFWREIKDPREIHSVFCRKIRGLLVNERENKDNSGPKTTSVENAQATEDYKALKDENKATTFIAESGRLSSSSITVKLVRDGIFVFDQYFYQDEKVEDCNIKILNEEGYEIENMLFADIQLNYYIEFQKIRYLISYIADEQSIDTDSQFVKGLQKGVNEYGVEKVPGLICNESGAYRIKGGVPSNHEENSECPIIRLGPHDILMGQHPCLWGIPGNKRLKKVVQRRYEKEYCRMSELMSTFEDKSELLIFMLSEEVAYFDVMFKGGRFWKQREDETWKAVVDWIEILNHIGAKFKTLIEEKEEKDVIDSLILQTETAALGMPSVEQREGGTCWAKIGNCKGILKLIETTFKALTQNNDDRFLPINAAALGKRSAAAAGMSCGMDVENLECRSSDNDDGGGKMPADQKDNGGDGGCDGNWGGGSGGDDGNNSDGSSEGGDNGDDFVRILEGLEHIKNWVCIG